MGKMVQTVMPEDGFDPGPDEEDYIPWDCDHE